MSSERYDKKMPYPSQFLQAKGEVIFDSYYYVIDGTLSIADDKYDCEFEVARFFGGQIYAVAYLPDGWIYDLDSDSYQYKLIGKEVILEREVVVDVTRPYGYGVNIGITFGTRVTFLVDRFSVGQIEEDVDSYYLFIIKNLPLYDPTKAAGPDRIGKRMADSAFSVARAKIEAELQSLDDLDAILKQSTEVYANSIQESLKSIHPVMEIKHGDAIIAKLFKFSMIDELVNHGATTLLQILEDVPDGWEVETLADWLCKLLSLAFGRHVDWIVRKSFLMDLPTTFEVWKTGTIGDIVFVPFITDEHTNNLLKRGLKRSDFQMYLQPFIGAILSKLFASESEKFEDYALALNSYIFYLSTPGSDQMKATLLSVMPEYILKLWKSVEGITLDNSKAKQRRRKFANDVKKLIDENANVLFGDATDVSAEVQRFKSIMGNKIKDSLEGGLYKDLIWLFEENGYSRTSAFVDRVKSLVDSRNSLAHEHCFHTERSEDLKDLETKLFKEKTNIESMVAIMLAIVLGYQGMYYDSHWNTRTEIPIS